jgi:hypothetical protein
MRSLDPGFLQQPLPAGVAPLSPLLLSLTRHVLPPLQQAGSRVPAATSVLSDAVARECDLDELSGPGATALLGALLRQSRTEAVDSAFAASSLAAWRASVVHRDALSLPSRPERRAAALSSFSPRCPLLDAEEWLHRHTLHGAHAPLLSPAAWNKHDLASLVSLRSAFPGIRWLDISGLTGQPETALDLVLGRTGAVQGAPRLTDGDRATPAAVIGLDSIGRPQVSIKFVGTGTSDAGALAWVADLEGLSTALSSGFFTTEVPLALSVPLPGLIDTWNVLILRAADWLSADRAIESLTTFAPHVTVLFCPGSEDDFRLATRFLSKHALRLQKRVMQLQKATAVVRPKVPQQRVPLTARGDCKSRGNAVARALPPLLSEVMDALEHLTPGATVIRPAYDTVTTSSRSSGRYRTMMTDPLPEQATATAAPSIAAPYSLLSAAVVALAERHGIVITVINPPPSVW